MTHQYRFGDILIDPQSFRLLQAGKPLAIEPKALNVLIFLVQHQGRLIERRELLSAIWGDAFVTDHVLNRSIGQLRKILGDDAKEPRYIETVPTLGYRFIAPVEKEPYESSLPPLLSPAPIDPPSIPGPATIEPVPTAAPAIPAIATNFFTLRWPILTACLTAVALLGFWFGHRLWHTDQPIRSLAVLPLDDLSPGTHEDYFADGMTDELITELARIPGLRVVSRTSILQNKGAHKPLTLLARELNVDAIVEGSVVRSGGRVRITAQLIDTRSDKHLWAQTFEGSLGDVLSLQDSVAREITRQTSAVLTPAAQAGLTNARYVDPVAHDDWLRGRFFMQRREGELAASYFRKAIALQSDYGAAYAGLAEALTTQALVDGLHANAFMPLAIAAANRAVQLDPYSGEAYTALGAIDATYLWDWSAAELNLRKGIELSPSSSDAETWLAVYLTSVARPAEAVTAMQRAVALDPLSFWANRLLGSMLYYARRYDESIAALQRASEIAPDKFELVEGWYSGIYAMQGRYQDAVAADLKDDASEFSPRDLDSFRTAFKTGGWKAYQQARMHFLLSPAASQCEMTPAAISYVLLGDLTSAFRSLNRDVDNRCGRTVFDLSSDPRLDPIRGDERFRLLLHRVNLPH